jgi:hypothetical protein
MKLIPKGLSRPMGSTLLSAKQSSPQLFFVGGLLGSVVSTVLACRATLKLEKTVEDIRNDLLTVKQLGDESKETGDYDEREYYQSLLVVYARSSVKIGKLYGPSVVVGSLSVAALTGSHMQMKRRNEALTLTLAGVMKAFDEYRIRVRDEIGEERELDIHRGVTKQTITGADGKKHVVPIIDPNKTSMYARSFNESNDNWQPNAEENRTFLMLQRNEANRILHSRGHIFLNEVYDMLGMAHSRAGAVVGWMYGPNAEGDEYIDFGLFEAWQINQMDPEIWLDFNVDGPIYNKIWEPPCLEDLSDHRLEQDQS